MHRSGGSGCEGRLDQLSALSADAKVLPEDGLRCGGSQTYKNFGPHRRQFGFQSGAAGGDLERVWLLVEAAVAAWLPFEVFDDVRHIDLFSVNPCLFQGAIKEFARRPHEGTALQVFIIPWLFADEHQIRVARAFAEDGLRTTLP